MEIEPGKDFEQSIININKKNIGFKEKFYTSFDNVIEKIFEWVKKIKKGENKVLSLSLKDCNINNLFQFEIWNGVDSGVFKNYWKNGEEESNKKFKEIFEIIDFFKEYFFSYKKFGLFFHELFQNLYDGSGKESFDLFFECINLNRIKILKITTKNKVAYENQGKWKKEFKERIEILIEKLEKGNNFSSIKQLVENNSNENNGRGGVGLHYIMSFLNQYSKEKILEDFGKIKILGLGEKEKEHQNEKNYYPYKVYLEEKNGIYILIQEFYLLPLSDYKKQKTKKLK